MIKPYKELLLALRSIVTSEDERIFVNFDCVTATLVCSGDKKKSVDLQRWSPILRSALQELSSGNFLRIESKGPNAYNIKLTGNAFLFEEKEQEARKNLLLEKAWLPIIVTIATTLVIDAAKWLFPLLKQWLASFHG